MYRRFHGDFLVWGVGLMGEGLVGGSFLWGICHGGEKFNEKGAGFSSITIKKQWKNKHENVFSNESKE